jgi:hypothetical protein
MNREGSDSNGIPELRTAAIAVWYYQRMEAKEAWAATLKMNAEQLHRVEQFRAELLRIVGERDDISFKVNGGCVEAEVEDLRFVAFEITPPHKQEILTLVTLLGRCPICSAETISEPIFNLAGLGERLEKFKPIGHHPCLMHK